MPQAQLKAICQSRFPFLGKMRSPGDVITAEELAQTSLAVRDALVSQKHIILDGVTKEQGDGSLGEKLDHLAARVDKLIETFASGGQVFQRQIDALAKELKALKGQSITSAKTQPEAPSEQTSAPGARPGKKAGAKVTEAKADG